MLSDLGNRKSKIVDKLNELEESTTISSREKGSNFRELKSLRK